jgi:hypothetical protein
MKKATIWTYLLVVMSSCASVQSTDQVTKDKESDLICKYEKTVGSNMKRKVCRTPEQMALQRDTAREAMTRMQTGSEVNGQ